MKRHVALAGLALIMAAGCASKLERERVINRPVGEAEVAVSGPLKKGTTVEQRLDLNRISFTDLNGGQTVSLGAYMKSHQLDSMLLLFGSRNCAGCNREATELRDRVVGQHPLFAGSRAGKFEFVAVNIDDAGAHEAVIRFRTMNRFSFIRWSDPRGQMLARYFIPRGMGLGVPLTVLVNREGVVWRYTNKDAFTLDQLVSRVEKFVKIPSAISAGGVKLPAPQMPEPSAPTHQVKEPELGLLASPVADRLSDVIVRRTDGSATTLGSQLGDAELQVVQAVRGSCDVQCQDNQAAIASFCQAAGDCASAIVENDLEFFDTFKTRFNTHSIAEDAETFALTLRDVQGPLVLVFTRAGELVYAKEGSVDASTISAALQAGEPGDAPAWSLYDGATGARSLMSRVADADYTIVTVFGRMCGGCIDELKHWSVAGGALDLCRAKPGQCQWLALENTAPDTMVGDLAGEHASLKAELDRQGIRVPVAFDAQPMDEANQGYLKRFADGYVAASYPEWGFVNSTFVYDRDGKVVAAFKAPTTPEELKEDHVGNALAKLLK